MLILHAGEFCDDHMIDFPELILSGMATPDIARKGIPVTSPAPLRVESIMGVPTKATDVFLDIDIDELLMDYHYDLESRQDEADNILRLLLRHASHLKQLYKIYSCIGRSMTVDKTTIMSKLQFFRFLKDYGMHRYGSSVIEMERLLREDLNERDYFRKQIFLRDFLNSLIRISYILFRDEVEDENQYVVSTCFKKLLQALLVPPETVQINGYVFTSVEKCQEVMKHVELFIEVYHYFSELFSYKKSNDFILTQRHLLFVFDELRLLSDDLTPSKLVDVITKEDKDEEGFFNLGNNFDDDFLSILTNKRSLSFHIEIDANFPAGVNACKNETAQVLI